MTYFTVLSLPLCLKWNNGSYLTPDSGDRQLSETRLHLHLRAVTFTEPYRSWVNAFATAVGHRCLHTAIWTRHSSPVCPDTLEWTYLNKHWTALTATIFQRLCMWNVRIDIKIYIKISLHYCTRFNLCSLVVNWHCIWPVGSLHGLSLSQTLFHWSSHQPNAINTRLQPLAVQLTDLVRRSWNKYVTTLSGVAYARYTCELLDKIMPEAKVKYEHNFNKISKFYLH